MNMPWCNTIGVMWYMFISQEIWTEKCQFQIILLFGFKVTQRLPTYQHPGGKGRDDRVTRRWLWSLFLWALQGAHIQRKWSAFFKKVCFVPIQQLGWNKRTSSFEWNGWLVGWLFVGWDYHQTLVGVCWAGQPRMFVTNKLQKVLKKLDSNNDGQLSKDQLQLRGYW